MRVSPVAWVARSVEQAELLAAETAMVTHNHPEGVKGAQATAACVYLARCGFDNAEIRAYVERNHGYDLNFTLDQIRADYTFDVSCQGSVPQAIVAFLESDGFEDAVRRAVSIGGDSDTIAAITGGIAHARYGIPMDIVLETRVRLYADMRNALDRFAALYL
jgi:ADP-ribosylglycohydrolase